MLWIAVHLPQLSLESFAATVNPAWRDRPMALIEAHRITQVDARAAQLGIQPGAKRATALALAGDLVLGQADPARDAQALQAAALCGAFVHSDGVRASLRQLGRRRTGRAARGASQLAFFQRPSQDWSIACSACCIRSATGCSSRARPRRSVQPCSRAGAVTSCTARTAATSARCNAFLTMRRCGCSAPAANTGKRCKAWACGSSPTCGICRARGWRGASAPRCWPISTVRVAMRRIRASRSSAQKYSSSASSCSHEPTTRSR